MIYTAGTGGVKVYNDAGVLQWSYDTGGQARRILTDAANNVYIGGTAADNGDGNGTRNLWKLNNTGDYIAGAYVQSSAQVYNIALDTNYIYVATLAGAARLTVALSSETDILIGDSAPSIAVDSNGNIFIGGGSGENFYKYNSDLVQQWTKTPKVGANVRGIGILSNGNIVIGFETGDNDTVWCYDTDGNVQWDNSEAVTSVRSIAIYNDIVYAVGDTANKQFVAIDADGNTLYSIDIGDTAWGIGITPGGIPYLATNRVVGTNTVYKVDTDAETAAVFADTGATCFGVTGEGDIPTSPIVDKQYSKKLTAIGNNQFWYESAVDTMTLLTDSAVHGELDSSLLLAMVEAYQKVFIANKTNLKVADFINTKITTGAIGASPPDRGSILTGVTSGAIMIVDYITSLAGACVVYGTRTTAATFVDTETVGDGDTVSFVLTADEASPPQWYDWTVYGGSATYGAMPTKANLAALYRGRLVLSGHSNYPHQWYMSRVSNPWDWVYGTNDPLTAVAGNNTDAGEVGDIVTALIPFRDDYLIFGCATSIWLLRGDPACGGSLDSISSVTGIFGAQSWCWGPNNILYFIGSNGLYRALPPTFETIEPVSVATMPNLISDWELDSSLHRVTMQYDHRRNGIVICRTMLVDGSSNSFWYDIRSDGFFPESYPDVCGPFSMFFYEAEDDDYRRLLLGSNDGYIRYFDDDKKDDSGSTTTDTAISSHVTLPIQELGAENKEGKITSLTFTLAGGAAGGSFSDTDGLTYEIYTGDDPETVLEDIKDGATARESGTLSGTGRKNRIRKRVRGHAIGIRLSNTTAGETWAVERIVSNNIPAGDE